VATLERLQQLGFVISLDDFGTGYSSLSHLKQFPLDIVKIDRLFVSNLTAERRDEAIVTAVVGMADAFALDVIAEGIETPEQAARLAELGCRFGQGFHFAKPTFARELEATPRLQVAGDRDQAEPRPRADSASSLES
jgi:EAL domain-containing protein (putative c-di-GMP-specific phosphodiesterase class I)